jgi:hypothetical protein
VWLATSVRPNSPNGPPGTVLSFVGDSDAHIVRGLIAILFALYSGKLAQEILSTDAVELFDRLGLRERPRPPAEGEHPEGRDDGQTWSFDPVGLRRTQSIGGGVLQSFTVTVSSSFTIGQLTFTTKDLTIGYVPSSSTSARVSGVRSTGF